MSNPADSGGTERFYDRKHLAKRLEKTNFSQTCSLLSQLMKEKRSLGDLNRENSARKKARDELEKLKPSTTTIIMPKSTANSADNSRQKDNLPRLIGFPPSGFSENAANKGEFRRPPTPEPAAAQMTIFYAGKVMVFNDFPNNKAEELMALATKGSRTAAPAATPVTAPATAAIPNRSVSAHSTAEPIVVSTPQPADLNKPTQEQPLKQQTEAKDSELPIARRASLHRFFAKRKDRAVARAPYQANQQEAEAPYKASGSGASTEPRREPEPEPEEDFPRQLDLNL